jgi:hypothetical protein
VDRFVEDGSKFEPTAPEPRLEAAGDSADPGALSSSPVTALAAVDGIVAPIAAESVSVPVQAELPVGPSLWSPDPGPAVVAAADITIVPAPTIWTMPSDALPDPEPSDYEFAVAILERLRGFAPILTDALVDTLGRCDKRKLLIIFGMNSTETAPEPEPPPAEPELTLSHDWAWTAGKAGLEHAVYDDRGYRISPKLPSAFDYTRDSERPVRNNWRTR